jgi:protein KRI1
MSKKVLDLSDSSDEELNISCDYAINYDKWRRKEELQKLKDKYGNNLDVISDEDIDGTDPTDDGSDGSTSSESDDSLTDGEQVFDDQFFKVYSALKSKNPSIYDKNVKYFDQNQDNNEIDVKDEEVIENKPKDKKMTLKEYHQKLIKEKKGITEEDEQLFNESKDKPKGYYEELFDIRNEFKTVLKSQESDESDSEELFKNKTDLSLKQNQKKVNFLDENNAKDIDKDLNFLKNYWKNDKELEESEKYLRDYIINKRYVTQKEDELFSKPVLENQLLDSNQNEMFDSIDTNETNENEVQINKYHFEEPESMSIKRYPRIINSIRDSTVSENRAIKRSEVKERKKRQKEQELKRLRKLKREEIKEKLNKLREISGNDRIDVKDLDLNVLLDDENDFDSSKYDQKMELLFGDNYYGNENDNESKPKFDYINEIDDYDYNEDIYEKVSLCY